jgi:hypothetical protein
LPGNSVYFPERWESAQEMAQTRADLCKNSGVLLLTADTDFAAPTTAQGKLL